MVLAQSFEKDPIPLWDTMGAPMSPTPRLGPAVLGAGGCNLMVRCRGIDPTLARSTRFQEDFLLAVGTAVGRDHIQTGAFLTQRDPTCLDLLLNFRVEALSTARMHEIGDGGTLDFVMADGTQPNCEAFVVPSEVRSDEVQLMVRGFRLEWGRVGVTRLLLQCAGYRDTDVQVLRESHGAYSNRFTALWPGFGKGDILVAVVRPLAGDRELRKLPRELVDPFMGLNISIHVQGRADGHARQGVAPSPPPNPFRQQQREQHRAYRASQRGQAHTGRATPCPSAPHPVPRAPPDAQAPSAHAPQEPLQTASPTPPPQPEV
jgi:hypothetical protein